jgi:hypothetical protein
MRREQTHPSKSPSPFNIVVMIVSFSIVVIIAFQNVFRLKIYRNNMFFIFKIHFLY